MKPLRLLWLEQVVLRWWKWAMREIDKTHPDVGWIMFRIRQIEDQLNRRGHAGMAAEVTEPRSLRRWENRET